MLYATMADAQVGPPTPLYPGAAEDTPAATQPQTDAPPASSPPPSAQAAGSVDAPFPGMPASSPPPTSSAPPGPPPEPDSNTEAHADIQASPLAPASALSVAAGPAGAQALPAALWADTPRTAVDALLPQLQPSTSPSLQSLAIRLLASDGAAPGAPQAAGAADPLWPAIRAERLEALGRTDLALALLRATPPEQMNADMGQVMVDLAFLDGDDKTACDLVGRRHPDWQSHFWDEAQLTCQALGGQTGPAQISLDALQEEQVKDDGFIALVQRTLGIPAKVPDGWTASPALALPLFAKSGQPFPHKAIADAPPSLLRALSIRAGLPPETRLAATEKAAAFGAISADRLSEAYLSIPLDDAALAKPSSREGEGARSRAILFAGAHGATEPVAKANLIAGFLDKIDHTDLYAAGVRAAAPMIDTVAPGPALRPVAAGFARALLFSGKPDAARGWIGLLDPDEQARIAPFAHIAGADTDWGKTPLVAAFGDGKQAGSAIVKAALTARLLAAEGTPAPDDLLLPLYTEAKGGAWSVPVAGPALLIDNAAAGKRVGATVLGILISLGSDGANANPPVVERAIAALRMAGLADDARRLALDAALARGL